MEVYYHYTNEEGAKAIEKSKKILASSGGGTDAVFGPGVYLTKIGPENSGIVVLKNNYDDATSMLKANADKADYVIEIKLPPEKVKKCCSQRDVYLYEGDLDLRDKEYRIIKLRKDKK